MILLFVLIGSSAYLISYREFHGTRKEFGRAMDGVKNKLDKPLMYTCTLAEMLLFNAYTFRTLSTSKAAYNRRMSSARQVMRDAQAKMDDFDSTERKSTNSEPDNAILKNIQMSSGRVRSTSDIHEL